MVEFFSAGESSTEKMAGKKESDEMETPKCTSLRKRERESSGIRIFSQELVVVVVAAAAAAI